MVLNLSMILCVCTDLVISTVLSEPGSKNPKSVAGLSHISLAVYVVIFAYMKRIK